MVCLVWCRIARRFDPGPGVTPLLGQRARFADVLRARTLWSGMCHDGAGP